MGKSTWWRKLRERWSLRHRGKVVARQRQQMHAKGDVMSPIWLVECKSSEDAVIRIEFSWIREIEAQATDEQKTYALAAMYDIKYSMDYCVFVDRTFEDFIECDVESVEGYENAKGIMLPGWIFTSMAEGPLEAGRDTMDTDEQGRLPDSSQEGEKPRPLTQDEEKILIIMQHAAQEFTILHGAWNEFRNKVDGLAICQTELLGSR